MPVTTNRPAIIRLSALLPSPLFSVVWKLSLGSQEKQFRFRQSFQSALPMSGNLCGPRLLITWFIEILRCSKRLTSVPGWLSKGTCSARIEKSPVSLI
ncbi:Uncharacterised protein [Segatella copri]|nr:Uncharacterised protein [Segatella copri]